MKIRTDKDFWSSRWNKLIPRNEPKETSFWDKLFDKWLRPREEVLMYNLVEKLLPIDKTFKVMEIGSAPGNRIVSLAKRFGWVPYGIEYSPVGAKINRAIFKISGFSEDNVLEKDFFSDDFIEEYGNSMDVVCSFGFIEHFDNPDLVIGRHIKIVRDGGYLLCTIPNLKGLNGLIMKKADPALLEAHNLDIMDIIRYKKLFSSFNTDILFAGYIGFINLGLCTSGLFDNKNILGKAIYRLQQISNILQLLLLRTKNITSKVTSPYLIVICRKIGDA